MPPPDEHDALTDDQIDLFKKWINEGVSRAPTGPLQKPERPGIPKSSFDENANGNLDRFVFHRLEAEGLKPSPPESPGRMLRRLSLALTGLPPTSGEFEASLNRHTTSTQSKQLKTRWMTCSADPRSENAASMWLDLVRYADSGGLGQDQRRTIWAYRDWVVKAFNDDVPFRRIQAKQLAGDLPPRPSPRRSGGHQVIGTLKPTTREGPTTKFFESRRWSIESTQLGKPGAR